MIVACPHCQRPEVPFEESELPFRCQKCDFVATTMEDFGEVSHGKRVPRLPPPRYPPLTEAEIERRLAICARCEYWQADKRGCKVCGTCGSGQAMLSGLMRDAGKKCPHPKGAKWGPPDLLRVAFLSPALLMGGAERWIASLCRHFDATKAWPQYVVTLTKDRSPIVLSWLPKYTTVATVEHLPAILKKTDVLISWGVPHLAVLTKDAPCKIVEVQHGTLGFGDDQRALAQAGIDAKAELTAVGEACLENYPEEYRSRVTVIQNGAELDRLKPIEGREATRAKLGIKPEEKVCLYIGRIAAVKNLPTLMEAVKLIPGWKLIIAGPSYNPLPSSENVIILPAQEHLGDLFAAADVFAAPSHHEANSLAVIEAWLAGVPVVTTDYPAAVEMQERHGLMSVLVPIGCSPAKLAEAICYAEAGRWKEKAQRIAMENYTAEKMTANWQEYLCRLKTQ